MKLNNIYLRFFQYFKKQPKELHAWEEIETSHENYFTGMEVKQMVHNPPTIEDVLKIMMVRL